MVEFGYFHRTASTVVYVTLIGLLTFSTYIFKKFKVLSNAIGHFDGYTATILLSFLSTSF